MKKHLSIFALVAAAMLGGAFSAHAFFEPADDFGGPPAARRMSPEKHFARMAKELKLSDAQKEQIQAIVKSERQRLAPLKEKLAENRKALRQAAEAEKFDEATVKSLAADQANLQAELIASRVRMYNQIHTLLTPEQRELAKKFRARERGREHKRHRE